MHGKIECTPSKHIPYVCQTKNNLHKFFYWLHLVYNTDYHQPMRWLSDDGRRGDGSRCFYNRTSAVVAHATGVTG